MNKHILIFGPGGVGKTTVGQILATKLDFKFIDLDQEFCDRVENVSVYIKKYSYNKYCRKNSKIFDEIRKEIKTNSVIALSSGFLIYDELGLENYLKISSFGYKVLLLPSRDIETATNIVVKRQMGRGFGLVDIDEIIKFRERFHKYQKYKYDSVVYSQQSPELLANSLYKFMKLSDFPKT